MKPITVILAEDHTIVREGLRALLDSEAGIEVVGEAEDGRAAVTLTCKLKPDAVVMDIGMPLLNGLEATRRILRAFPATKVLILSAHCDEAYVKQMIALGAAGYLTKQSAAHVLPKALRAICQGRNFFSSAITARFGYLFQPHRRSVPTSAGSQPLSSRETEVLQLIAEGKANKETAAELHISIKTVQKHRQSLMDKLNIHDTASLTRYAISVGIIESNPPVAAAAPKAPSDNYAISIQLLSGDQNPS